MKIVVLDRNSLGVDTPLCGLEEFGEVVVYDNLAELFKPTKRRINSQ